MKPKKLVRSKMINKFQKDEWEMIHDQDELNKLYALKIEEELEEIKNSHHTDIMEFVDLVQVAFSFAASNGFDGEQLSKGIIEKTQDKGTYGRLALTNLNPDNPSNALYFNMSIDDIPKAKKVKKSKVKLDEK